MAYYAQIVDDIVTDVIVVNDDITNGTQFCFDLYGGVWVQTFTDTDKNFAGIGYTYDAATNNFIAPQPYPSWTLDANGDWQPPTPKPPMPPPTQWNEQLQEWVVL